MRKTPYLTLDNKADDAELVLMEIDDLKRREQSVATLGDYAEAILRTSRDPFVILGADLRIHTANEGFYTTFKIQSGEAVGRLIYDLGNSQWNIPRLRQLLEDVLPRSTFFDNFEVTHDFESIGQRTMLLNARTLSGISGEPGRILLGIQDVTEVLQFRAAAKESQTRYRALIEASAQTVWTTDPTGMVVEDSPSWRIFTGQTEKQRKGSGWLDALHPDDRDRVSKLWQRAVAEHTPVETEYRLRHITGDWRWMSMRSVPVSDSDGSIREWVGMNIDITARKQGEEARARLAAIVESSDDAIIGKDLNGVITSWNKGAERLFGYSAQEVVGKPVTILIPQERLDEEPSILQRIRRGERIDHFETVRRHKDGRSMDVSLTVSSVIDSGGQVVGASKIARDITGRKQKDEALRSAAEFDEAVMANMGEGLYTVDGQGLVTFLNPAAEKMFGWKLADLRGKKMHDTTHYKHRDGRPYPAEECSGLQVLRSGKTLTNHEDVFIRKDGTFFDVIYSSAPLKSGNAIVGLVVVFRDVSDRKRAEEALRQSHAELRAQAEELSRFNRVAVGREGRMIELKKEVNELCQRQGQPPRYPLEFEQTREQTHD
jgi:PAS domain S-box-containing protein